jgi:hypothetical protein
MWSRNCIPFWSTSVHPRVCVARSFLFCVMLCRSLLVLSFLCFRSLSCLSDRQDNDLKHKNKRTNNDLQNITQKTKDRTTRTKIKTGCEVRCSGKESRSCFTCGARRGTLIRNPVISHEKGKDRIMITTNGIYKWSFVTRSISAF